MENFIFCAVRPGLFPQFLPLPCPCDLPDFQINISLHSFQSVRLDFTGSLLIKSVKNSALKAYILLFTCASSCAIHLELTPDMPISSIIRTVRRFVSRRGEPDQVISENNSVKEKNYFFIHGVK